MDINLQNHLISIIGRQKFDNKYIIKYKHNNDIPNFHPSVCFQFQLVCDSLCAHEIYKNNGYSGLAQKHIIQARNDMKSLYWGELVPEKKAFYTNVWYLP